MNWGNIKAFINKGHYSDIIKLAILVNVWMYELSDLFCDIVS